MKSFMVFALVSFFACAASADESVTQSVEDTGKKVAEVLAETRQRREKSNYFVLGNYSFLDLLIPGKYGLTLGYIKSADQTWEVEYLRGTISVPFFVKDLGSMTDERLALIGRSYMGGNSFNFSYSLSYFDFSLHIGDKLLNRVSGRKNRRFSTMLRINPTKTMWMLRLSLCRIFRVWRF